MIRHRRFREMLARRVELTAADERRLSDHLAHCPDCRATAAAYEQQWQLLRTLPSLETPPTLRASVLHRIRTETAIPTPWHQNRLGIVAPLIAAAVLLLVGATWVAGSRLTGQPGNHAALSTHAATPTPRSSTGGTLTQSPRASVVAGSVKSRPGRPKRLPTILPAHLHSNPVTGNRARRQTRASSGAAPGVTLTTPSVAPQPAPTPPRFGSSSSVAASVPTAHAKNPVAPASRKHASGVRRPAQATSSPRATALPTAGPVKIAAGPPPTLVAPAQPVRAAPVQGTPSPVDAAPAAPPVIAVTPGTENTPLPIIPSTPPPLPAASVRNGSPTPTPTPTVTPHP